MLRFLCPERQRESELQPARERQRTLSLSICDTHSSFLSHFVPCSKAVVVRRNDAHDTTTNGSAREVRVRKVSVQNLFIGITSRHAALPYADGVVICTLIGHCQCPGATTTAIGSVRQLLLQLQLLQRQRDKHNNTTQQKQSTTKVLCRRLRLCRCSRRRSI